MIYLSFKPEQASYKGDQSNQVKHNFVPAGLFFYQVFDGYYGKKQAQEVIKNHDNFTYHSKFPYPVTKKVSFELKMIIKMAVRVIIIQGSQAFFIDDQ
jgi:hypothetical protein